MAYESDAEPIKMGYWSDLITKRGLDGVTAHTVDRFGEA